MKFKQMFMPLGLLLLVAFCTTGFLLPAKSWATEEITSVEKTQVSGHHGAFGMGGISQSVSGVYVGGTLGQASPVFRYSNSSDFLFSGFWFPNVLEIMSGTPDPELFVNALVGNYPNPFNPSTQLDFSIAKKANVSLVIYNIRGQAVCSLLNEAMGAGVHSVHWDGNDSFGRPVGSGVYFSHLTVEGFSESKKMLLIK